MLYRTLSLILALSLSQSVNAALFVEDWQQSADGATTFDDASNLWWLDLTETIGMSFQEVSAELTEGGAYEGWRYATLDEATDIYAQFGLTSGAENLPIDEFTTAIDTMNSYFGDTMAASINAEPGQVVSHSGNWGFTGTEWPGFPDWHIMFLAYTADTGATAVLDLGIEYSAQTGDAWPYAGSLLVASENPASFVPLPAAAWLLGSSLFGLLFVSRRQKV